METELKYVTTLDQCQDVINKRDTVCGRCGGQLKPIETVDNSGNPTFWPGCTDCQVYDHSGVKSLYFQIAKHLVEKRNYRAYSHEPEPEKDSEYYHHWVKSQIGGISREVHEIISLYKAMT